MFLREVYVENFGVLKDYRYEPQKGLNCIYGENGTGKSTLAEFIKAMLYGMPQTRNRKQLDDAQRKKYMPWDGGRCGGYIVFEVKGNTYRLSRYFGEKEKDDTFSLTDLKTGLESDDYSVNIGEELFGIDREAYSMTAWIGSKGMEFSANDSVHAKLGESMEYSADMGDCEKGLNRLEDAQKQYVRTGRRGLLFETEDALTEIEVKKHEQELCVENIRERMNDLKKKESVNDADMEESLAWSSKDQKRLELLDDHFSKGIPSDDSINRLIVDCQVRVKELQKQEKSCTKVMKAMKGIIGFIAVIAAIAMIIAIVYVLWKFGLFGSMLKELFCALVVIGSAAMLLAFPFFMIRGKKSTKAESLREEEKTLQAKIERCEKERNLVKEYKELSHREEIYSKYKSHMAATAHNKEVEAVTEKYDKSVSKLQEIKDREKSYKQDLVEYQKKVEIISKAKMYLDDAKNSYISNYKDNIVDSLKKYIAVFDEKLAETVMMDTELALKVMEGADAKEMAYFSAGYKDVMWFCERLAIVDSVYKTEKPVLILDDAFAAMDDKMTKKAVGLLKELSKDMQIIYMTCRESDKV